MMLWRRFKYLLPWCRRAAERDMQEELRSLAAMADPGELGNLTLAAEDARTAWGWTRIEQAGRDLQYALRSLRRAPGFTLAAVLSLALGIGANTALFTLINAVTWRMLPVADPESLLVLSQRQPAALWNGFTYQQYSLIRDHNRVLDLAAYSAVRLNVSIEGHPEPTADGLLVSGSYFSLLGVRPAAGRILGAHDDRVPMGHPVAMISHEYWKRRFVLDPATVGGQLTFSGVPFTIVGVTPPGFFGVEVGTAPEVFVPLMMQPVVMPVSENLLDRPVLFSTWLRVVGRLKPGVSAAQATAALGALAQEAEWRPPAKSGGVADSTLEVTSAATGLSDLRRQFSLPLRILMGVVGIVLLIACANTGNLVLARSAARRPEFALRLALGAGRFRLIRQVLVEGLLLAGLAGLCGVALAYGATEVLLAYVSAGRDAVVLDLSPDARVLGFTAAVSAISGLLFASAPAIRASRLDLSVDGGRELATRHAVSGRLPGRVLVMVQVALSLVLLVGAGLFVRSLQNLHRQQARIDRDHILVVRVEPRGSDQRNLPGVSARLDRIYRDLQTRVENVPGVLSASLARSSPLAPISHTTSLTLSSARNVNIPCLMIYPRYFATMGISIVSGRDFHERDLGPDSPLVALVNETFVRRFLNGQQPLGSSHGVMLSGRPLEIIGVVEDSRYPNLHDATPPMSYQTFLQTRTGRGQMVLHVRFAGNAGTIVPRIRNVVQSIDPDVPTFEIRTFADEVDAALVRERLIATLSGFFGLAAVMLVSVGLYGLTSFTVSRRTAEIGVRVALGAMPADVAWLILRQTLTLVLVGIAVGLPAAWTIARLASRQLSSMLFDLRPSDPVTTAAAAGLLIVVAMCAGVIPALRAARIDPIVALRAD